MVIGPGADPTRAEAKDFCDRWPGMLERRLPWLQQEVGDLVPMNGSTASLDPLVHFVVERIGEVQAVSPEPEWYGERLHEVGWSAYGAALAEGLMAYVAAIYAEHLGGVLPWVLDEDPKSAYHLKPVVDLPAIAPPWRQVMGVVRQVQSGGDPAKLRTAVEHSLAQHGQQAYETRSQDGPWVVVTPLPEKRRWQVSLPEDVDERLGSAAYASLEDRFAAVEGVTDALMEDRDRALVRTRRGVSQADLESRLEGVVADLARGSTPSG